MSLILVATTVSLEIPSNHFAVCTRPHLAEQKKGTQLTKQTSKSNVSRFLLKNMMTALIYIISMHFDPSSAKVGVCLKDP